MFKMIYQMILDLAIFLILWSVILIMFGSASGLVFGETPIYGVFVDNLIFHFETALGNWDGRATCKLSQAGFIS